MMLKKIAMATLLMSTAALVIGCSSSLSEKDIDTAKIVNAQMETLAVSVNNSLDRLLQITRGDEPGRDMLSPIATTVAGEKFAGEKLQPLFVPVYEADGASEASLAVIEARLNTTVNVNFINGNLNELVGKLAKDIGYNFKELGNIPAQPLKVSLTAKNQTIRSVLATAANQVLTKADIIADIPTRTIIINYL